MKQKNMHDYVKLFQNMHTAHEMNVKTVLNN